MSDWITEFGKEYKVPEKQLRKAGMIDCSWHNDICPCFGFDTDCEVSLWIEHPDPEQRESGPGAKRYTVNTREQYEGMECSTDSWIEAVAAAKRFHRAIYDVAREKLEKEGFRWVGASNEAASTTEEGRKGMVQKWEADGYEVRWLKGAMWNLYVRKSVNPEAFNKCFSVKEAWAEKPRKERFIFTSKTCRYGFSNLTVEFRFYLPQFSVDQFAWIAASAHEELSEILSGHSIHQKEWAVSCNRAGHYLFTVIPAFKVPSDAVLSQHGINWGKS